MAVLSIWRKGVSSGSGEWNDDRSRSYTWTLGVATSDATDSEPEILAAVAAVYPLYSAYPTDPLALVKSIKAKREEWVLRWEAEVEWSTLTLDEAQQVDDPREKPALVSWSTEQFTEAIEYDINGAYVANTAGDPFEGGLEVERQRLIMTVQKNFSTVSETLISNSYLRRTNSVSYRGFDIGKVLFREWAAQEQYENGIFYYATTYTFAIDERLTAAGAALNWRVPVLNAGPNYLDAVDNLTPFTDPDGRQRSRDGLLALDGTALPAGNAALFRYFTVYDTADFNTLGLF